MQDLAPAPLTLRDVARALVKRLGANPLKVLATEIPNEITHKAQVTKLELRFLSLNPRVVARAMEGLKKEVYQRTSGTFYTHEGIWTYSGKRIRFCCRLYVYKDGSQIFHLVPDWTNRLAVSDKKGVAKPGTEKPAPIKVNHEGPTYENFFVALAVSDTNKLVVKTMSGWALVKDLTKTERDAIRRFVNKDPACPFNKYLYKE